MSRKPTVYLAGPIVGCNGNEALDWRKYVTDALAGSSITGISPLRCEPLAVGGTYTEQYPDLRFGTPKAIASKNLFDVRHSDMTFVYIPDSLAQRRAPWGSICELNWAWVLNKPTILVTDHEPLIKHPVIQVCTGWILPTLQDGIDVAVGILGDYAR